MALTIHTLPAFTDNYIWLFHQDSDDQAYVVDPGDANPVIDALDRLNLQLKGIVITHHHPDHVGGISELQSRFPVPVYGPEGIQGVTKIMHHGDILELAGCSFEVMAVPGHTLDHLAYFDPMKPLVFCGDTLFAGGCGRLFEGTPAQMWASLSLLAKLPSDTKVFCTHEYTQANLSFALRVEPDNPALQQRANEVETLRRQHIPTVPSTMAIELATNPFLRVEYESVQKAAENYSGSPVTTSEECFATVRRWKDNA